MGLDSQERRAARSLLDYWQLWLLLIGGIVGSITFYNNVKTVVDKQKDFEGKVEARREKNRDTLEADHIKAAVQANDIEWLKKGYRQK